MDAISARRSCHVGGGQVDSSVSFHCVRCHPAGKPDTSNLTGTLCRKGSRARAIRIVAVGERPLRGEYHTMATALNDYLFRHAPRMIELSLRRVEGKPVSFVSQEDQYRQMVMLPGWGSLPQPIRILLKRQHAAWEEMYFALR